MLGSAAPRKEISRAPKISAQERLPGVNRIDIAHLLSDGPRKAKKRPIAASLPDDGLAHCASASVTGRGLRPVLTTGPPAIAGGYSPMAMTLPNNTLIVNERGIMAVRAGRFGSEVNL